MSRSPWAATPRHATPRHATPLLEGVDRDDLEAAVLDHDVERDLVRNLRGRAGLRRMDVGAVLVTPAHQYPTGAVLAPERRAALLDWASRSGAVIIEDDYDAEYRYDREPVGALQGLAPDRVAYLGSASKTLAPALRLGWLVLPAGLAADVALAKLQADRGSPALEQLAFADFPGAGRVRSPPEENPTPVCSPPRPLGSGPACAPAEASGPRSSRGPPPPRRAGSAGRRASRRRGGCQTVSPGLWRALPSDGSGQRATGSGSRIRRLALPGGRRRSQATGVSAGACI